MTAPVQQKYLDIAAELVNQDVAGEPPSGHLAGRARFDEVAKRMGVARSALYRLWPTQLDYWRDLVKYAVSEPTMSVSDLFDPEPGVVPSNPEDPLDLEAVIDRLRLRVTQATEVLASDAKDMIRTGLAGYPRVEGVNELASTVERDDRRVAASRLAGGLQAAGRRPIAPLTMIDLVTCIEMMLDGAVINGRTYPWFIEHRVVLDDLPGRPWSLAALGIRAVLTEFTEEGELTADDRSLLGDPVQGKTAHQHDAARPAWNAAQCEALEVGIGIIAGPDSAAATTGTGVALGHVTLARVARAAGVTRRQMYHLWPTQAEFRRDLIDHLVRPKRVDFLDRFSGAVQAAFEAGHDRFVLEMVEAINAHRLTEAEPTPDVSFALQPLLGEPGLAEWRRQARQDLLNDYRGRVAAVAQIWDADPLGGLTIDDVSGLSIIGAAGSERLHRADPTGLRYGLPWRGRRYSLFAILNQALMEHVMVIPPGTPESA